MILFATFFEKKVAPKNFQREVFSAHSGLDQCIAIIDCFLGRRGRRPLQLKGLFCAFDDCAVVYFHFLGPSRTPVPTIEWDISCVLPICSKSVGEGLAPPEKKQI